MQSDVTDRLSEDSHLAQSTFNSVVFDPGIGGLALAHNWGYRPGPTADVELELDLDTSNYQVAYTEATAIPSPVESTNKRAKWTNVDARVVIRVSGRERRDIGESQQGASTDRGTAYYDRKIARGMMVLRRGLHLYFIAQATYGFAGIVSAGTYALGSSSALNRSATYTKAQSYELNASSADVSIDLLNKFAHLASDSPYGCSPNVAMASATQAYKLAQAGGDKFAFPSVQQAGELVVTGLSIGGAPVIVVPDFTTSLILLLTGAKRPDGPDMGEMGDWGRVMNEPNAGGYHVLDLGSNNHDWVLNVQLSTALSLCCKSPQRQAKLYGLST